MLCAEKAVLSNIRYSILPLYVQFTEISDAQRLEFAYICCCLQSVFNPFIPNLLLSVGSSAHKIVSKAS